ncbi:hypothetical protein ACJJTC_005467 [Scirpophaga incertulas]
MGTGSSTRTVEFRNTAQQNFKDVEIDRHISITNKMIERIVDSATPHSKTYLTPRGDFKDKIYTEKLKCIDESHSEQYGITEDDLRATIDSIELRTANMVSPEPVCGECSDRVINCYLESETPADIVHCCDTVGEN